MSEDSGKRPLYFSVDFEDFSHDVLREFHLEADPVIRVDALNRSIDAIQAFIEARFERKQATFFCTAILAEKCPEVIRRIAALGHEIGCHYYFHDAVRDDAPHIVARRLEDARNRLQDVSGQPVLGFRAPRFSIDGDDAVRYQAIENVFLYDSSLIVDRHEELQEAYPRLGLTRLRLFPVGRHKISGIPFSMRSGGTYLKLFPAASGLALLRRSADNGLMPMLYLHPYEFVADCSFFLNWWDLRGMPAARRALFVLRQSQWHIVGNRGMPAKLARVFDEFTHCGSMKDLLETGYGMPVSSRRAKT